MQLIQEAGPLGAVVVVVFVVALFARASGRSTSATPWALSLLALGQLGQALAQRTVADAMEKIDGTVQMLAVGCAEASANLLLAGACALIVVVVGAARDRLAQH
ncbi:MAG: hypothetical protein Q8O67_31290 [Deltaproteobacteria bacterium]|nr:hypothetical protein [Deltaproteobacteria bacterium]